MATHRDGGSGALSSTLTTSLNSAARDRYLLIHVATGGTGGPVTFDRGTGTFRKLADAVTVDANQARTFGPFFVPNGHSLRGGIASGSADYSIDEVEP